jgi:hypothetical protein
MFEVSYSCKQLTKYLAVACKILYLLSSCINLVLAVVHLNDVSQGIYICHILVIQKLVILFHHIVLPFNS